MQFPISQYTFPSVISGFTQCSSHLLASNIQWLRLRNDGFVPISAYHGYAMVLPWYGFTIVIPLFNHYINLYIYIYTTLIPLLCPSWLCLCYSIVLPHCYSIVIPCSMQYDPHVLCFFLFFSGELENPSTWTRHLTAQPRVDQASGMMKGLISAAGDVWNWSVVGHQWHNNGRTMV